MLSIGGDYRPRPLARTPLKVPDQFTTCPRMPLPVDLEVELKD